VFAQQVYHTGASGYTTLLSTSGAGAVAGALVVAGLGDIRHKGYTALVMQIAFGCVITAFAFSPSLWLAYPLVFLAGVAMMIVFLLISSLVQLLVIDEMRGRVMSIYLVAFRGGLPLGALTTGWLSGHFPIERILAVEGALLALLAFAFILSPSKVKEH